MTDLDFKVCAKCEQRKTGDPILMWVARALLKNIGAR